MMHYEVKIYIDAKLLYEYHAMKLSIIHKMEKKQSSLLPSGYPFSGLIKLQQA